MNRTLRLLGATLAAGVVTLSLPGLTAQANAATATAPNCASKAQWYDAVPLKKPKESIGRFRQLLIAEATHCLIDAERAKAGLPPLKWNNTLRKAAVEHAHAAVQQKWWVEGADPHVNPKTESTPISRIKAAGYCPNARSWAGYEIAYTGPDGDGTPRAAIRWWMSSSTHRAIILDRSLTEIGPYAVGGSADPAHANAKKSGTYVVTFGRCR